MKNKQKLDQHFMIDKELLKRIINYSELNKSDVVLEIGPGKGALTDLLVEKAFVYAVEIDKDLVLILKNKFKNEDNKNLSHLSSSYPRNKLRGITDSHFRLNFLELPQQKQNLSLKAEVFCFCNNIKIIQGNALNIIKNLSFNKLVANIPYSISEPLLNQILIKQPEIVVLTVGINFIKYLKNNELFKTIYELEIKEELNKKVFYPAPDTDSAIVKFILKEDKTALLFQDLLKQHDKKIKNALIESFRGTFTKNQVREMIKPFKKKDKSILSLDKEIKELKELIRSFLH